MELALPAGSLQCALWAFKNGADAVYLGLKEFSARKNAVNFSFDDLSKLKYIAEQNNKKIYITINTLLEDSDFSDVRKLLNRLRFYSPDGIIIQDLGLANLINKEYPELEIHGSTQLAVYSTQGVKALQKIGFKRVVLSRELTKTEIIKIRKDCPDIELKVFIHGALCYGFSGLCMASQKITGRSANKGECAQICRTWFTHKNTDGYFFSMKDLSLEDKILELKEIGIDSLKVEGRMKGPEYSAAVAAYYSAILKGESNDKLKETMYTTFSRLTTEGFFSEKENLVSINYPGHTGIKVGTIQKILGNGKAQVKLDNHIALHDGLLAINKMNSYKFPLQYIGIDNKKKSFASKGDTVIINFSENGNKYPFGTPLYCISQSSGNIPKINENIPLYRKKIAVKIILEDDKIDCNGVIFNKEAQEAKNVDNEYHAFNKIFQSGGKHFIADKLTIINNTSYKNVFYPLSFIKELRRNFFEIIDEKLINADNKKIENYKLPIFKELKEKLPPRKALGLFDNLTVINNKQYYVMNPLVFDWKVYSAKMEKLITNNENLIVGINNISQLEWAEQHPKTKIFTDIFFYLENSYALDWVTHVLPNWIGDYSINENIDVAPVFISRVCFRKNSLGLSCKNCSKTGAWNISQKEKNYKVEVNNCITYVTEN